MTLSRLVSVVIPAYKATYFEAAIESVFRQNYEAIEIVIGDDCRDDSIANLVKALSHKSPWPIRYFRNQSALGEIGNVTRCVEESRGEYVKFLYDDDIIVPDCVRLLVDALEGTSGVSLVSSRRRLIDEFGKFLPDNAATSFPFDKDVVLLGGDVVSFWGDNSFNFVGEPTSVLCRREDLVAFGDGIFSLAKHEIQWLGDLAVYSKLLRRGNLALLARPLSYFRISKEQYSQKARDDQSVGVEWHRKFKALIHQLGWVRCTDNNGVVRVAPLDAPEEFNPYDLLAHFTSLASPVAQVPSLQQWLAARMPTSLQREMISEYLGLHGGGPEVVIVVLDLQGDTAKLIVTIRSLGLDRGLYATLKILVLSAAAVPVSAPVDKLHFIQIDGQNYIAELNIALRESTAEWFMLVDAGDEFTTSGLMIAALELIQAPGCRAIYGDELQRLAGGVLGGVFRPSVNLDLLLSFPRAMARHWLFRREVFLEVGGFDAAFAEALEFDLVLRLIEQGGLAGLGHVAEPLLITDAPVLQDSPTERAAIERHLAVRGYVADVGSDWPARYRINYVHAEKPLVSIIIPTKDQLPMLRRCVETLLEKTRYANYEVLIVDNNSETAEAREWLAAIDNMGEQQVRVLRYPHAFNFSAINNMAVNEARGEYVVLLNNDTAIISECWLDEMLNHAQRPEVGIVGAKLLYPNGHVQHAGVVLGLRGPADHPFIDESIDAVGYMHRLQVVQNYTAVTAACLMMRKELYLTVGGMDEQAFKVSYNDVDLCLKAHDAGFLIVWTPHAVVMHEGSISQKAVDVATQEAKRARFVGEQDALYGKWLPLLANDPAYNKNLSLNGKGFELETEVPLNWRPLVWRPQPIVLAHPADAWGCGNYRITKPFSAMAAAGLIDGMLAKGLLHVMDLERYDPDVIVLQRQTADDQLEAIRRMQAFSRAFKVYELDDYLPNLPIKSVHRKDMPKDVMRSLRRGLGYVDRFVVSTQALADSFSGLHENIHVIENCLPVEWWKGLTSQRRRGRKPRVGWAGGVGHAGDLELIVDVVKELVNEVEWVFFGMCPEKLRGYVHEVHAGIDIERYPAALAALDLDLALAPLEQNLFNECKSNLRLLEYGACGFPVICTDIRCYQGDLPVTRVKNRFRDWVDAIRMHITDLDATAQQGDALKQAVLQGWMLEGENLELWRKAWLPD